MNTQRDLRVKSFNIISGKLTLKLLQNLKDEWFLDFLELKEINEIMYQQQREKILNQMNSTR